MFFRIQRRKITVLILKEKLYASLIIIMCHCFKLYVILVCSYLWGFLFFLGGPRNIRNPQNTAFLIKAVNF